MKHLRTLKFFVVSTLIAAIFLVAPLASLAGESTAGGTTSTVSCDCPQLKCAPCEEEVGTDFYTEKCGPDLSRVKSCKRRHCEPVHEQKICLSKLGLLPQEPARAIASEPVVKPPPEASRSADVILAVGQAFVQRARMSREMKEPLAKGMQVSVGDRITTLEDGRVRLRFPELSEVFISPGTSLVVAETLIEKRMGPAKRTILLDLAKGRVRSRVQGRYDDGESKFEVKTKSAVAGVRGTDFTVTFEPGEKQWKTEVHTIQGEVSLDGRGGERGSQHVGVTAATYAAHLVPAPAEGATSFEVEAALERGFVTPLFKMSPADITELMRSTEVVLNADAVTNLAKLGRDPAAGDTALCRAPAGAFNQCAWSCEGGAKASKKDSRGVSSAKGSACRTDLPGVQCVRRLCRANGQWGEATVLPTKQGGSCEAGTTIVGDCGGYW